MLQRESTLVAKVLTSLLLVSMSSCAAAPPFAGIDAANCTAVSEADLEAFASEQTLDDCAIEIRRTQLTSLDALDGLLEVNGILLDNNPSLGDTDSLERMEDIGVLSSVSTPLQADLDVTAVSRDIHVFTSGLVSVSGEQEVLQLIQFERNSVLSDLSFTRLQEAFHLTLDGNLSLTNLINAFPSLTSLGQLTVRNHPLVSVQEIQSLAVQANVPTSEIFHCGNADDAPCE